MGLDQATQKEGREGGEGKGREERKGYPKAKL